MAIPTNYVIFDCNGSSDDAWALALLLKADSIGKVKLLAITCAPGPLKVERVARNMDQILQTKQRGDIPIYLFPGSRFMPHGYDTNFHSQYDHQKNHRHGKDVFENLLEDDLVNERTIQPKHAVHAIKDLVNMHPNQVTIICTGPLTNVALSLAIYGAEFAARIKALYIMGGAYQAVGNITRAAEFNLHLDPEAAHIVLARAKCPITIIPWEACSKDSFSISADWRFKVLGANENDDFIKFMNRLERGVIGGGGRHADWIPYDSMIVAVFLFKNHFVGTESKYNAKVELFGKYSRGEMILDHLKNVATNPLNATIVEKVNAETFKLIAMWAADYRGTDSDYIQGLL